MRRKPKGYSLLELVITITIMSILLMSIAQLFAAQVQQIQRLRVVTGVTELATLHDIAYRSNELGIGAPTVELFLDRQYGAGQVGETSKLWGNESTEYYIVRDLTLPRAAYEFQHKNGRIKVCYIPPDNPMVEISRKVLIGPCDTHQDALEPTSETLPTPMNLAGQATGSTVELTFTPLDPGFGSVLYSVYRCESTIAPCNPDSLVGTTSSGVFLDPNRPAGSSFTYTVTASTPFAVSNPTSPLNVPISPLAPVFAAAVWNASQESVILRWSPPFQGITDITGYAIWRCVNPCTPSNLDVRGTVEATGSLTYGFDDGTAELGTSYAYAVVALNPAGQSLADASRVDVLTPPNAPTNLSASVSDGDVTVSWDSTPTASGYTLRRCAGEVCVVVATLMTPTYTEKDVAPGTYTYTITARNAAGDSPTSTPLVVAVS